MENRQRIRTRAIELCSPGVRRPNCPSATRCRYWQCDIPESKSIAFRISKENPTRDNSGFPIHFFVSCSRRQDFAGIAVLTLALAIGLNSAVFALINGIVLRHGARRISPRCLLAHHETRRAANRFRSRHWFTPCAGRRPPAHADSLRGQSRDPAALLASSVLLAAAALLACYLPARRATRVSPMTGVALTPRVTDSPKVSAFQTATLFSA